MTGPWWKPWWKLCKVLFFFSIAMIPFALGGPWLGIVIYVFLFFAILIIDAIRQAVFGHTNTFWDPGPNNGFE